MSTGMFQQDFHGGDKHRVSRLASAIQSAPHWKIVEAAVHSKLPPLNKGAIDKKSQQHPAPLPTFPYFRNQPNQKTESKIHTAFMYYPTNMTPRTGESCFQKRVSNPILPSPILLFSNTEAGFPQPPTTRENRYPKPIHLQPKQLCLIQPFTCLRSIGVLISISCALHVSNTFL
jgi:hypothetical protein